LLECCMLVQVLSSTTICRLAELVALDCVMQCVYVYAVWYSLYNKMNFPLVAMDLSTKQTEENLICRKGNVAPFRRVELRILQCLVWKWRKCFLWQCDYNVKKRWWK
jgi:hypothetical protein